MARPFVSEWIVTGCSIYFCKWFWLYEFNWNGFGYFHVKGLSCCSEFVFTPDFWTHFVPCLKYIFHVLICNTYHRMYSIFSLFLFFFFETLTFDFSPVIYAKHALVSHPLCLKLKDDVDLMCKYCKKLWVKNAEVCEITNRTEWKSCEKKNNVMMNVVRNIFLYFEIIRKKGQKYKVGKSCQKNTTKGMFLLIYKFFA